MKSYTKGLMVGLLSIVYIFLTMGWIPFGNSKEVEDSSPPLESYIGKYQILSRYAGLDCEDELSTGYCEWYIQHILLNTKNGELTIAERTDPYIFIDIKELPDMDTVLLKDGKTEQRYQASIERIEGIAGGRFIITIIDTMSGEIVKEYRVTGMGK